MKIWGITDGSAGMQSQVEGVLQAFAQPYEIKVCKRKKPWVWLPVACYVGALKQLEGEPLSPPWPDAVVTSGRRSAPIGLAIKAASGGHTKAIHLTDPRGCRRRFDLIVAMAHDPAEGDNVIHTHFALHRLTPEMLRLAASKWQPRFAYLPRPYAVVLIGGTTRYYTLTADAVRFIINELHGLMEREACSLLITPSRRTGAEGLELLRKAFEGDRRVYLHGLEGENPYTGMLGLADHVIVTDDSVNMMSEASATGKPLHILHLPGHSDTRPARFAQRLIAEGVARKLEFGLASWNYGVPDEMGRVTTEIRRLLAV